VTKIVAWVVLALAVVVLILGGATQEVITGGVVLVVGIVAAVSALIAFIVNAIKKDE
jgi:hypothetical protein